MGSTRFREPREAAVGAGVALEVTRAEDVEIEAEVAEAEVVARGDPTRPHPIRHDLNRVRQMEIRSARPTWY